MEPLNSLARSIGPLVRPVPSLFAEDSLDRAAAILREQKASTLIVVGEFATVGLTSEASLARALADGLPNGSPVSGALDAQVPTLAVNATVAEAMRFFLDSGSAEAVVFDLNGAPLGLLSPSDLYPKRIVEPRPPMVGGMATPFGVYLTNGSIQAGAKGLPLVATGALLFLLFVVGAVSANWVNGQLFAHFVLPNAVKSVLINALPLVFFLGGMRLIPLSGIHAAEHKVVHAIERGEALTPEIVDRMPRVHPRCGTNLAAAAGLFMGIFSSTWIPWEETRFLAAALVTLFFWRPLGYWMQKLVTTRPPSPKQIELGIKAGKDLLNQYRENQRTSANPLVRIYASGMLHVIAGSTLAYIALDQISTWLHFDIVL